jgi:hypothetical protein
MRLFDLAVLYLLVGTGCAVAVALVGRASAGRRALDATLVLLLWPIAGPFLLATSAPPSPPQPPPATPAEAMLPDRTSIQALSDRLAAASARVAALDELLLRPDYSEEEAETALRTLVAQGASDVQVTAATMRLGRIKRLRRSRERWAGELEDAAQVLKEVTARAEIVRLAGGPDPSTAELTRDLIARVEGLDEMLDDDDHHPHR